MEMGDNPFADMAGMVLDSIQFEWGLALLIVGAALLLYSGGAGEEKRYIAKTNEKLQKTQLGYAHVFQRAGHVSLKAYGDTYPPIELSNDREVILGRSSKVDIHLDDRFVSGRHVSLRKNTNDEIVVQDLGSTNGTYIESIKLTPYTEYILKRGDKLIIGSEDVVYTIV
jgi:hypothetical protein